MFWLLAAGAAGAAAGYFTGSKKSKKYIKVPYYTEDPRAGVLKGDLYPAIESGIEGKGLFPGLISQTRSSMIGATKKEFEESGPEFQSRIERSIPTKDVKVRGFLAEQRKANLARQVESINRDVELAEYEDQQTAKEMAVGAISAEKKIGTGVVSAYSASALRQYDKPTYGSELMQGLGGAAGIYLASRGQQTGTQTAGGNYPPSSVSGVDYVPPRPINNAYETPSAGPYDYAYTFNRTA